MKVAAPKDFYLIVVIAMIRLLGFLPSTGVKRFVTHVVSTVAYCLSGDKRGRSAKNVAAAFGESLSRKEIQKIVKRSFYEFWWDALSIMPHGRERDALRDVEITGIDHLREALKRGRGVILVMSNNLGRLTLLKQVLFERGFCIHKIHAENHLGGFQGDGNVDTWVRRHLARPFFERCECAFVAGIIYLPTTNTLAYTRVLLDRLKRNGVLGVAGDGRFGMRRIPAKLLGFTEYFPTGMVSLAKMSGATVLPTFCVEELAGQQKLIIEPPVRTSFGMGRERDLEMTIFNYVNLLESYVRRYPEQYRNWQLLGTENCPVRGPG